MANSDSFDDRKTLPPFATLRAFEAVGRYAGIRKAAQALMLDHAVVSRHLRALEEWAGVRLVNRAHGYASLTEEGLRYHASICAALGEIRDATAHLMTRNDASRLSIWCVPGFASEYLAARLGSFQAQHPGLELELHPTDRSPDFSRHEADVDIRYIHGDETSCTPGVTAGIRRVQLARPPVMAVTSPGCATLLGNIQSPADLVNAPLLHEEGPLQWHAWFTAHAIEVPLNLAGPRLWHAHLTIEAARRGQGVALANPFLLGDDFATGRLVPLLGETVVERPVSLGAYAFLARADRWQSSKLVSFRRWLKQITQESSGLEQCVARTATRYRGTAPFNSSVAAMAGN
jgi:LysR family transcriptional regulator, glycine cleavage system transcriptional activator